MFSSIEIYPAPTVSAITPSNGSPDGGLAGTIDGTEAACANAFAQFVAFDTLAAQVFHDGAILSTRRCDVCKRACAGAIAALYADM